MKTFLSFIQHLVAKLRLFRKPRKVILTGIFIAKSAGQAMSSIPTLQAIKDKGLEGDRYCAGQGYWHPVESCQVTLITESDIKSVQGRSSTELQEGEHRRNLVISGCSIRQLKGHQFCIGEAIFAYLKPRPPCGYIDTITFKGMAKALGKRSGICLLVIQSGQIRVGDELKLVPKSD